MEFKLNEEYIELIKLLKATNLVGSGGEAKLHVSTGAVKVNGETELRKRCKIRVGAVVEFDGNKIQVV